MTNARPSGCLRWIAIGLLTSRLATIAADFSEVQSLFQKHCVECHGALEPDAGLNLETYTGLMHGGESGPAIEPGKANDSLLIKAVLGNWGKTGKNQYMPPGKRDHLQAEQVSLIRTWINAGAPNSATNPPPTSAIIVPKVPVRGNPRRPVVGLAAHPTLPWLAVARPEAIEWIQSDSRTLRHRLAVTHGVVNDVAVSGDGQFVFAASGQPGRNGEVWQWRTDTGGWVRTYSGHHDAFHAVSISPDGRTVAAGSYDFGISIWDTGTGDLRQTIRGHQGAVMGLSFHPDGRWLASASYDRTAKLFDPLTGARRETFGQALKELNAVRFSPDGQLVITAGNDNRLRAYRLGVDAQEGSNELIATVFASEGSLLRLAFAPDGRSMAVAADDRTVQILSVPELAPRHKLELQPDWPTSLAFAGADHLAVGRADGSLEVYRASDGTRIPPTPPPLPQLFQIEPRGLQSGVETTFTLTGTNLSPVTVVTVSTDHLIAALRPEVESNRITFTYVHPPDAEAPRHPLEISVSSPAGDSGRLKVWVDDLPQTSGSLLQLPSDVWGTLEVSGQTREYRFSAPAGTTLLFDLAAERIGSRGDYLLTLLDSSGRSLVVNDGYRNQKDPLILHTFSEAGDYRIRVTEATYAGSSQHTFRLTIGELPFVTGIFPLTLPESSETEITCQGANLPDGGRIRVVTETAGWTGLPMAARNWRSRRDWKFAVAAEPTILEREPNQTAQQAQMVAMPSVVNGQLSGPGDPDCFRFSAKAGETYVLETAAAQRGSSADTRLEVLWPDGRPVERLRLQAVRDSAVTFRPVDANNSGIRFENWEEMELNDYLYCGGDVLRLFRAPQGPDSDSVLYTAGGKRRAWFETTATAHYLGEPVYVVRPAPPNSPPQPNGLPTFPIFAENDDASLRDLGTDSRLLFTAPESGDFLVRLTDVSSQERTASAYALTLRAARPDFAIQLNGAPTRIARASGQPFSFALRRFDGFDDPVTIEISGLPHGWTVSQPIVIEAGQETALVTLNAAPDAQQPTGPEWDAVGIVATAWPGGLPMAVRAGSLGRPQLTTEPPKILVSLLPAEGESNAVPSTVTLRPGSTARAKLKVQRLGFDGVISFSVDNLPHGVIVENLGLNGITFLAEESEREISIAAAHWVSELERPFHAVENQAGRQTSLPLLLRVRKAGSEVAPRPH